MLLAVLESRAYLTEKPFSLVSGAGESGAFSAEGPSSSKGLERDDPDGALQGLPSLKQGDCGRDCMDRIKAWDTWLLKDRMISRESPSRPLWLWASVGGLVFKGRLLVLKLAG